MILRFSGLRQKYELIWSNFKYFVIMVERFPLSALNRVHLKHLDTENIIGKVTISKDKLIG
jgi:hypothetical protein